MLHKPRLSTVEYFEQLPAARHADMVRIRYMIQLQWPKCKEDMLYGVPTFHIDGQPLFAFASQKEHNTFYLMPKEMLSVFKNDLRTRNCGKSCIRFKKIEQEDMELLERIVKFVGTTFTGVAPKLRGFANIR